MQRFLAWLLAWARWLAVGVFSLFVIPLAVEFVKHVAENFGLYDRPQETANVVVKFLLDLAEQTWLRLTALALGCFVAGLWLGWFLRGLDGSRADKRKALGAEMAKLGNYLGQIKFPFPTKENARIISCFASAKRFGIWAPDDRAFSFQALRARSLITDYLSKVGQMLSDGNFREAKQYAKNRKADFDSIAHRN